ncbi:uncharacterized protein LOC134303392 [Trichomycterus rosablanca]|uniref:uncharacterized protein LOC134303392 n=1 Tax=Trichomycterus rosablanca TaxID=2290929 RepID=UPI002F35E69D
MQSAEEEHVAPVDLQHEGFQKKLIKKEDEDDSYYCEVSLIPPELVPSVELLFSEDQQCGGFQMKPVKKEEPEDEDELKISGEGTIIPVELVTSEEHLTPEDQQCGGFQMKPVKKEEAEEEDELKLNKDFFCSSCPRSSTTQNHLHNHIRSCNHDKYDDALVKIKTEHEDLTSYREVWCAGDELSLRSRDGVSAAHRAGYLVNQL